MDWKETAANVLFLVTMGVGLSVFMAGLGLMAIGKWERKRRRMGIGVTPRKWMMRK